MGEWHSQRWPIFAAAIRSTEGRRDAREREEEAVKQYQERRAIPKKEKTKGKSKKKKQEEPAEEGKKEKPKKGKKTEEKEKDPKESATDHVDKVLDAVVTKMRADMEEERRRARLNEVRTEDCEEREGTARERNEANLSGKGSLQKKRCRGGTRRHRATVDHA